MDNKTKASFLRHYKNLQEKLNDVSPDGKWSIDNKELWTTAKKLELYETMNPIMEALQLSLLETIKDSAFLSNTLTEMMREVTMAPSPTVTTNNAAGSIVNGSLPSNTKGSLINGPVVDNTVKSNSVIVGEVTQPEGMPILGTAYGNPENGVDMSQSSLVGPPDPEISYSES